MHTESKQNKQSALPLLHCSQKYKLASSLSDFAVQVKILASVKAASAFPDTANNGQLVALTTNLGKVLQQVLD